KAHDVSWTVDAQAGEGQLHARPFLDLADAGDVAKLEPLATQGYDATLDLGGTISGEHGCGLLRTQFLRRPYGELVQVFREVKDAFDPLNVLNPGKVIGDDPHLMLRDLRRLAAGGLAGEDEPTPVTAVTAVEPEDIPPAAEATDGSEPHMLPILR